MEKGIRNWTLMGISILVWILWFICGNLTIDPALARDDTPGGDKEHMSVVITPARMITFEERIETYGNVEAKKYALVSARIPGIIDTIFVDEGDYVIKDKTRIFQTDKIKVNQAVEIARHSVSVAEFTHKTKLAQIAKIEVDLEKAHIDYERFKRLYEDDKAVTKNAFEVQEARFKQISVALEEAHTNADLSLRQLEQARSRLIIASKDLEDSQVCAPITGYITSRFREPGEMAGAGTPVVRIDDLSVLEICAFLPAQYYSRIINGETIMRVTVNNVDAGDLPVTYKSPIIDSRLRNFEVKAKLSNPPEGIAPGAMAKIDVILNTGIAIGVPGKAILKRLSGKIIFLAEGEKARMVKIETGLEVDGWIEILSGDIREGSSIITMGQDQLEDGSLISVLRKDQD